MRSDRTHSASHLHHDRPALDHHHEERDRVYGWCLRVYFEVINLENILMSLGYRVFNKLSLFWIQSSELCERWAQFIGRRACGLFMSTYPLALGCELSCSGSEWRTLGLWAMNFATRFSSCQTSLVLSDWLRVGDSIFGCEFTWT